MAQGERTSRIALQLSHELAGSGLALFYDHGDRTADGERVREVQGFLDASAVGNESKIAAFDLVIYDRSTKRAACVIEVEESYASPKKLLGDVMAFQLSKLIAIKDGRKKPHMPMVVTADTLFIVATWRKKKGRGVQNLNRLEAAIQERYANVRFVVSRGETRDEARDQVVADVVGVVLRFCQQGLAA